MKNIRILICDDHILVRTGFISLLKEEEGIFFVGEADNGNEMISKYFQTTPDLIIADISMPGGISGIEAFNKIRETVPDVKVLFISAYYSEQYIYYALTAGAMGMLDKNINKGELLFAITEIIDGRRYFGSDYTREKLTQIQKKYNTKKKSGTNYDMDSFDDNMLTYIAEGLTSKEIADRLCVSKHTIDSHRAKIMRKNKLGTGNDLLRFAVLYSENKKI